MTDTTDGMDDPKELLDLVDGNDQHIGIIARQEIPNLETDKRGYVRAIGVFILNQYGRLWVPRRQPDKKIAPNGLDFSAGEHVQYDETYLAAAIRGLQEELHITADQSLLKLTGTIPPFPAMPYFHQIFLYHSNQSPQFNTADYSGFEWISPADLEARLARGEPAKEILLPSVRLLLAKQLNEGVHL